MSVDSDPGSLTIPAAPRLPSPSDAPDPLPVYTPFGKFQLIAQLGKGGMGEVFLALLHGVQGVKKLVVIKRLLEPINDDRAMRDLFLEEGRLAARLNHSNVVQTIEVGEEAGALYLSMEYLEGQPLNQVVRKLGAERIDSHIAARIISDVLCGLHYAHELRDYDGRPLNIVHRDMSPHNIFITYEGEVKIVDFGIAKAASQASKTEVGVLKGKVAYMAPEQATSDATDRRADVFVVGIVLWELLTGTRLFAGAVQKTFYSLIQKPAPRVSSVVPDIDPELDDIVARALERDPQVRFASAKEMRDAVDAYIAKSGRLVRAEDLGALLGRLFAKRRERVRRQVRTYMSAVEAARSTNELPTLAPRRDGEGSSSALSVATHSLLASGTRPVHSAVQSRPVKQGSEWSRAQIQLSVAALLVVAFGGAFALARAGRGSADAKAQAPPAAQPEHMPVAVAPQAPLPRVSVLEQPADAVPSAATDPVGHGAKGTVAKTAGTGAIAAGSARPTVVAARTVATPTPAPVNAESSGPSSAADSSAQPSAPGKRKFRLTF
jgi:serine/threonine protein kinase